jgi:hypothetical protein
MDNPQGEAVDIPQPGKGKEHGSGVRAARNRRQQDGPRGKGTQTPVNRGFKIIHSN